MNNRQALRVVTLGDSLAYGTGDEHYSGLAKRLEDELHARGFRDAKTVNLGVNGAQTSDLKSRLRQQRFRDEIANASTIVLSIGANDLRQPSTREAAMEDPLGVAHKILDRIEAIVNELHALNGDARILILGGYNPVPGNIFAPMIEHYLALWDETLASRFADDARIAIVKMIDVVTPERLSRFDRFHPGAPAYAEAARRIAEMLVD
jgi:lysophospholipase L1-like esterase